MRSCVFRCFFILWLAFQGSAFAVTIGEQETGNDFCNNNAEKVLGSSWTCKATGNVNRILLHVKTAAGSGRVAIYDDPSPNAMPDNLVVESASQDLTTDWNVFIIAETTINFGEVYWLSFQTSSDITKISLYNDDLSNVRSTFRTEFSYAAFPDPFGTTAASQSWRFCMYATEYTPTPTFTSTISATYTATPSQTPTHTVTPVHTPSATPTITPTFTLTLTSTISPTCTLSPTPTVWLSATSTMTVEVPPIPHDLSKVFMYPNPWLGDPPGAQERIFFRNITPDATIRIYTIAGQLVYTLSAGDRADNGRTHFPINSDRAQWGMTSQNGAAVASGIYIYIITNTKGNEHRGKLAIVR